MSNQKVDIRRAKNSERHYVYFLVSSKGTIYAGQINDLHLAVHRHRTKEMPGQYDPKKLVYYEALEDMKAAHERVKELKALTRKQKIELITSVNPDWNSLPEG